MVTVTELNAMSEEEVEDFLLDEEVNTDDLDASQMMSVAINRFATDAEDADSEDDDFEEADEEEDEEEDEEDLEEDVDDEDEEDGPEEAPATEAGRVRLEGNPNPTKDLGTWAGGARTNL